MVVLLLMGLVHAVNAVFDENGLFSLFLIVRFDWLSYGPLTFLLPLRSLPGVCAYFDLRICF